MHHSITPPDINAYAESAFLTRAQVASLSGFAVVTLNAWAAKGRGPRITYIEGRPRYRVADVREWLEGSHA